MGTGRRETLPFRRGGLARVGQRLYGTLEEEQVAVLFLHSLISPVPRHPASSPPDTRA